jgi:hypothetical protein
MNVLWNTILPVEKNCASIKFMDTGYSSESLNLPSQSKQAIQVQWSVPKMATLLLSTSDVVFHGTHAEQGSLNFSGLAECMPSSFTYLVGRTIWSMLFKPHRLPCRRPTLFRCRNLLASPHYVRSSQD